MEGNAAVCFAFMRNRTVHRAVEFISLPSDMHLLVFDPFAGTGKNLAVAKQLIIFLS